jgi:hypothetical protein
LRNGARRPARAGRHCKHGGEAARYRNLLRLLRIDKLDAAGGKATAKGCGFILAIPRNQPDQNKTDYLL